MMLYAIINVKDINMKIKLKKAVQDRNTEKRLTVFYKVLLKLKPEESGIQSKLDTKIEQLTLPGLEQ